MENREIHFLRPEEVRQILNTTEAEFEQLSQLAGFPLYDFGVFTRIREDQLYNWLAGFAACGRTQAAETPTPEATAQPMEDPYPPAAPEVERATESVAENEEKPFKTVKSTSLPGFDFFDAQPPLDLIDADVREDPWPSPAETKAADTAAAAEQKQKKSRQSKKLAILETRLEKTATGWSCWIEGNTIDPKTGLLVRRYFSSNDREYVLKEASDAMTAQAHKMRRKKEAPHPLASHYSESECRKIMKDLPYTPEGNAIRLLLSSDLEVEELMVLKVEDLDPENMVITVHNKLADGKNGKNFYEPIPPYTLKVERAGEKAMTKLTEDLRPTDYVAYSLFSPTKRYSLPSFEKKYKSLMTRISGIRYLPLEHCRSIRRVTDLSTTI